MAELHVIGQIVGAAGFRGDGNGLFCKVRTSTRCSKKRRRSSLVSARAGKLRRLSLPANLPSPSNHPSTKTLQWSFHAGPAWDLVEGHSQGQIHVDRPHDGGCSLPGGGLGAGEPPIVWSHPLDVHYACRGLSGWPRLQVQVWREIDGRGRSEIC